MNLNIDPKFFIQAAVLHGEKQKNDRVKNQNQQGRSG